MTDWILTWLSGIPSELVVFLLAALPVTELRAALPVGMTVFHLSALEAFVFSVLGNTLPLFFLYACLPPLLTWASKHSPRLHGILERYFFRLSKKHEQSFRRYGTLFLAIFVAIPLPGSGVWTGSLLALLFRLPARYSIPAILIGLFLSGIIVLLLTQGSFELLQRV